LLFFLFLDFGLALIVPVPDLTNTYSSVVDKICDAISSAPEIEFLKENNNLDLYANVLFEGYPDDGDSNIITGSANFIIFGFKNKDEPICPPPTGPM
jgi:hypothetical protein